jgi:hypothetical protein
MEREITPKAAIRRSEGGLILEIIPSLDREAMKMKKRALSYP